MIRVFAGVPHGSHGADQALCSAQSWPQSRHSEQVTTTCQPQEPISRPHMALMSRMILCLLKRAEYVLRAGIDDAEPCNQLDWDIGFPQREALHVSRCSLAPFKADSRLGELLAAYRPSNWSIRLLCHIAFRLEGQPGCGARSLIKELGAPYHIQNTHFSEHIQVTSPQT